MTFTIEKLLEQEGLPPETLPTKIGARILASVKARPYIFKDGIPIGWTPEGVFILELIDWRGLRWAVFGDESEYPRTLTPHSWLPLEPIKHWKT